MRLIDADKLKDIKFHGEENLFEMGWNDAIDAIIENAPTIDAVEVVRCKGCWIWTDAVTENAEMKAR